MVRRLGNQVIVIMLLLLGMLGLASGALAAEIHQQTIGIIRVDPQVGGLGLDGQAPVSVHVVGALPCMNQVARTPEVSRNGNTVTVRILYDDPPGGICLTAEKSYEQDINLGSFELGSYTLRVNDYTTTFTVPGTLNIDVLLGQWWQQFSGFFGES